MFSLAAGLLTSQLMIATPNANSNERADTPTTCDYPGQFVDTRITGHPKPVKTKGRATFSFEEFDCNFPDEAQSQTRFDFTCILDKTVFDDVCHSPITYTALEPGRHRFQVFATYSDGNVAQTDHSWARFDWRIAKKH
jgi:hypothetical protein